MSQLAYLSLGSNVGDRKGHLLDAIRRLGEVARIESLSSFYETEPVELTSQDWFLNCAVVLATDKTPQHLMETLLAIEEEMGRQRTTKKGPRTIDLDIVLFGDVVLASPALTIPHPAMHRRRFVLEPLAEIAPQVRHPVLNQSVRELLEALPAGQAVRKLTEPSGPAKDHQG